jgi:hypothetical protein
MAHETIHDNSVNNKPVSTLCFVRNQKLSHIPNFPIKIIERTDWWNYFPISVFEDMKKQLKTVFNIELRVFSFKD